jgi:hypothetical protein
MAFHVMCPARCVSSEINLAPEVSCLFQAPNGARCETDFALGKAALAVLEPLCPMSLSFEDTLARAVARLAQAGISSPAIPTVPVELRNQLACFLLKVYTAGLVDFRLGLPGIATTVSERPVASPVARWQVEHRDFVTSLFHIAVQVEDEIGRSLLTWLDGTQDRAALLEKLWLLIKSKNAVAENVPESAAREDLERKLDENLQKLARLGLLVA